MKEKIIKSYVKQLTKQDISKYAEKQNIKLTSDELNLIYETIKNDLHTILNQPEYILQKAKKQLSLNTYNKIYDLYSIYYPKLYH